MSATVTTTFAGLVDLASAELGGKAMLCSDDFFAGMENLLKPEPAAFDPNAYTDRGKLMDGWESRRKRVPGHDWCIVRLGAPGTVRVVDIDTAFFLGNHPPFASVYACHAPGATPEHLRDHVDWTAIVPEMPLRRGSSNLALASDAREWTHVKLDIYPDGGVARLRVYGTPTPTSTEEPIDLIGTLNGGRAVACSDAFFASMDNLLLPHRAPHMGHGWETRRSRPPGEDWIIVRLGQVGRVQRLVADTHHFKGNYPDRCAVDGILWPDAPPHALVQSRDWSPVSPSTKLHADSAHNLDVTDEGPWSHLRLRILPDGGVSRLRAFGVPTGGVARSMDPGLARIARATDAELHAVCASRRWVEAMRRMISDGGPVSRAHLYGAAEAAWWQLGDGDWLEAFRGHPPIGATAATLQPHQAAEQSGITGADATTRAALTDGNRTYFERFGWIFLVCASGKTAPQMLALLNERLPNDPAAELRIAAGEEAKITRLRLDTLVASPLHGAP